MAATQADLGNVHLDIVGAVVMTAVGVERAPGGSFGGVQDVFQRGQCLVGQVRNLQVDRAAGRLDLAFHLGHHLTGPVVGVDEALPQRVDLVSAEWIGDIRARRPVVILDQRVDLEALDSGQFGAGVICHRIPVARIGGVFVSAVKVSGRG